jgi:hypothetical protein
VIFSAAMPGSFRRPRGAARPEDSSSKGRLDRGQYGSALARHPARVAQAWVGRAWSPFRVGVAGLALACAGTPVPCRSPGACPAGSECLAQRCAPLGSEPVALGSERLVLEPADMAVLPAHSKRQGGLPPSVTFGGGAGDGDELLVRFGGHFRARDVVAAFLVLEPAEGAEPSAEDVRLEVALAAHRWSSRGDTRSTGRRGPVGLGLARTRPAAPLRIDVTAQLRELGGEGGDEFGFVVRAAGASPRGAVYSTGGDGPPPRLDLYLRPAVSP